MIRGRSAESPALAAGLFNAADPKPNADFIFVRLFRVIGRIRHRANKQGETLLVFRDEGVEAVTRSILLPLWNSLSFSLRFCRRQLRVRLTHEEETYLVEEGEPLEITIRDERHVLHAGVPLTLKPAAREVVTA